MAPFVFLRSRDYHLCKDPFRVILVRDTKTFGAWARRSGAVRGGSGWHPDRRACVLRSGG
jgi:hypothetical protein